VLGRVDDVEPAGDICRGRGAYRVAADAAVATPTAIEPSTVAPTSPAPTRRLVVLLVVLVVFMVSFSHCPRGASRIPVREVFVLERLEIAVPRPMVVPPQRCGACTTSREERGSPPAGRGSPPLGGAAGPDPRSIEDMNLSIVSNVLLILLAVGGSPCGR
jgi:hypothetical protein